MPIRLRVKSQKAERAIRAALQLAPNNRFVLRSAARFIHIGEPEIARTLLVGAEAIQSDPWLMASEIAIAEFLGKPSRLPKNRVLRPRGARPRATRQNWLRLSGTLEAARGNGRIARRLLRQAVIGANKKTQWHRFNG